MKSRSLINPKTVFKYQNLRNSSLKGKKKNRLDFTPKYYYTQLLGLVAVAKNKVYFCMQIEIEHRLSHYMVKDT